MGKIPEGFFGMITETTLLPLSLVFTLSVGVVWATRLHGQVEVTEKRIDKNEVKIDNQTSLLLEIRDRLIRLEERQNKNR